MSTFAFDLAMLFLFIDVLHLQYIFATGVAFLIAISLNYVLSRKIVFQRTERTTEVGYINFILIALVGMAMTMGGMYLLVSYFFVHYILARMIVAVFVGIWNYIMNLYVNFDVMGKH